MEYEIVPLPRERWTGHPLPIGYTTEWYYDVMCDGFSTVTLEKKRFSSPVTHTPEEYDYPDRLYEECRQGAEAFGVVRGEELLCAVEIWREEWSNRLRVCELWVGEELRGKGFGRRLMELAISTARAEKRRAVMLETQSCNVNAIGFYRHMGFSLIGFDLCCYSNRDPERKEVRLELGMLLD